MFKMIGVLAGPRHAIMVLQESLDNGITHMFYCIMWVCGKGRLYSPSKSVHINSAVSEKCSFSLDFLFPLRSTWCYMVSAFKEALSSLKGGYVEAFINMAIGLFMIIFLLFQLVCLFVVAFLFHVYQRINCVFFPYRNDTMLMVLSTERNVKVLKIFSSFIFICNVKTCVLLVYSFNPS